LDLDRLVGFREGCRVRQPERSLSMGMNVVAKIRQATRKKYTAEEKIRIVLEGLRGEIPISELCRREGIAPTMYYRWSKAFLDAGKNGLTRDTQRDMTSDEVRALKDENATLKKALAESVLETMKFKKSLGM
jgi:transposase